MVAILLIDHGSRRTAANHMLSCMANLVQQLVGETAVVRYAHMELAEPSIGRGFADCVEAGADEVIAVPYMLSPGRHATSDIPLLVGEAAKAFPAVSYRVTQGLGVDERIGHLVLARAGLSSTDRSLPLTRSADCCWDPASSPGACGDACPATAPLANSPVADRG